MFETLAQLRAKPPHIKRHIAFWTSAGVTIVIAVFWLTSLRVTIAHQQVAELDGDVYVNSDAAQSGNQGSDASQSAPSPISGLTASVSDAFAPVGALFKSLFTDLSSAAQPPATTSAVEIYAAPGAPTSSVTPTVSSGNVPAVQNAPMQSYQ